MGKEGEEQTGDGVSDTRNDKDLLGAHPVRQETKAHERKKIPDMEGRDHRPGRRTGHLPLLLQNRDQGRIILKAQMEEKPGEAKIQQKEEGRFFRCELLDSHGWKGKTKRPVKFFTFLMAQRNPFCQSRAFSSDRSLPVPSRFPLISSLFLDTFLCKERKSILV